MKLLNISEMFGIAEWFRTISNVNELNSHVYTELLL